MCLLSCDTLHCLKIRVSLQQQEKAHHMQPLNHGPPSLQNSELNKALFLIIYQPAVFTHSNRKWVTNNNNITSKPWSLLPQGGSQFYTTLLLTSQWLPDHRTAPVSTGLLFAVQVNPLSNCEPKSLTISIPWFPSS
jgi:hypothetical protein